MELINISNNLLVFSFVHFFEREIQSVDENKTSTTDSAFNWKLQNTSNKKANQLEGAAKFVQKIHSCPTNFIGKKIGCRNDILIKLKIERFPCSDFLKKSFKGG